jgi:alpha-2-macroglobulin
MKRLLNSAGWLLAVLLLAFNMGVAAAQDRPISLLPGTDLPGFDYGVVKNTTLDACSQACSDDRTCRAFTFNEKAKWCFLKGDAGPQTEFAGATSGIVDPAVASSLATERLAELPFPAQDLYYYAQSYAAQFPTTDAPPKNLTYDDLVAAGDDAVATGNSAAANVSYRQALALNRNDPDLWIKLTDVQIDRADADLVNNNSSSAYDFSQNATYSAVNAYVLSQSVAERAKALGRLAAGLERRQMWRESIASYRASIALVDDAGLQGRLDQVVAEHGFRITSNEVDSEAADPRICVVFSDPLPAGDTDLSAYVVVDDAPQVAVETRDSQVCITGVKHGLRYHIRVRSGLPSATGEELRADAELDVYIPDRTPFVGFANNAYVMPAGLGGGLPITSVNASSADIAIYRIGDRNIATAVRQGIFQNTLDGYSAEDIADRYGQQEFEGTVDLSKGQSNDMTTTAIPVKETLGTLEPGAYVITAKVTGGKAEYWQEMATQWFIVTDLGLTTVSGEDGVHTFVRSLTSAQPVANSTVRLVAVNNEILGEATTDENGEATFAPGLARGDGGRAPQLVVAETEAGDSAFIEYTKPAFDLTDRGVDGRPTPGPLDLWATTERGVYRPGETVFITALLRDVKAKAVAKLPITLELERPDGVVAVRRVLNDGGAGGYTATLPLPPEAMRGSWTVRLYADPKQAALTSTSFKVEDFEPERLAFEVSAAPGAVTAGDVTEVDVAAKYLYGATAPGLDIEADSIVRAVPTLTEFPGYTFGREDDTFTTDYQPLGNVGQTDDEGNATAEITIPEPPATTRPLTATLAVRLVDTSGRAIQRNLTRPVTPLTDLIGLKPQFEGEDLSEGATASFDVIVVGTDGAQKAEPGLEWTLSRIETNYQWYRNNGVWKWEAVTTERETGNGTIDASATGPVSISSPVTYGRYRLEVNSTGDTASSSTYEFYAGYYYAEAGSDTPDELDVALDKSAYRPGDTAVLKLDPQFAGTALVLVVDNGIIDMKSVDVPAEGTSVGLPVTEQWGPGAYVTATLYRPADAKEKRMPARALGVAYADVEPGDLKLDVAIDKPDVASPRAPFTAKVKIANVAAGETAYVTVAAVDLGILNLTNFAVPDPDGWFFGQRQMGVEFRDLYGSLIDPTQGALGEVRSGGDGEGLATGTPPPTTVLVAQYSGIVTVGADGTAEVTFDMPDFNGTVRLMAIAWTANAIGHASADVIVRDPVVVNMTPPRFLRLDDTSRLLVEINNISGAPGAYKVELITGDGLSTDAATQSVDLPTGERTALDLSLTGTAIGDQSLKLIVTDPNGNALVKDLVLGVRAASGPVTTSVLVPLGVGEEVTLDSSRFEGLIPRSGTLTLAIGPMARLDVPELLLALDRYPYGCAEQVSSRALPLLYLNDVARLIGMGEDDALAQRIRDAIADELSKQNSAGGFGLWGPFSGSEFWLDAYVTDFLLRARAEGFAVPDQAMTMALDNLGNQLSYATDFSSGGEDIAYALLDLARAGRAAISDLRYYFEAKLDAFSTPLAKAQLGAALALYGDRTRAAEAFAAAVEGLKVPDDRYRWRTDYGSQLRDTAAVLALAAEFTPSGIDLGALTQQLADLRDATRWTSTQDDAWTLVAAANLARTAGTGKVTIDGEALEGTVYRKYDDVVIEGSPLVIRNDGNTPNEMTVSVTGIPATPPAASSDGFSITREYFAVDGTPIDDISQVTQNDRFVVKLTATPSQLGSGQYVIADPLPAGFEIENPNLLGDVGGVGDLSSWLVLDTPANVESRTDQYVAAFRIYSKVETVATAYLVRAVSPGSFVLPGATVEDMYRPELRGNTDAGHIEIANSGP